MPFRRTLRDTDVHIQSHSHHSHHSCRPRQLRTGRKYDFAHPGVRIRGRHEEALAIGAKRWDVPTKAN